jgi:hypothetical protein
MQVFLTAQIARTRNQLEVPARLVLHVPPH